MVLSNCAQDISCVGGGARRGNGVLRQEYRSHFLAGTWNLIIMCEWTAKLTMHTIEDDTPHLVTEHQRDTHAFKRL